MRETTAGQGAFSPGGPGIALLRAGMSGDMDGFATALAAVARAADDAGEADLALAARSAGGERGADRVEVPADPADVAAAFRAKLADPSLIPVGLSLVKTNVSLAHVVLPSHVKRTIEEFIEEQADNELYIANGLTPRNKMMLMGPPGNGKTALSKAIANTVGCPLYFVRYDALTSTVKGETAKRLYALFEFVKTHRCILFFDEIDAIGKERGDENDDGETKRVVSTLLVQLDDVPPHVIVLGATNHPGMLDKAVWRRFHVRLTLPEPMTDEFEAYLKLTFARYGHAPKTDLRILGIRLQAENFAETEVFVEDSVRAFVKGRGSVSIEEAIETAVVAWPRTRVKIPS